EASAKAPLKVVLAVPGKPVISTLAPPPRSGAEPVFEMLNLGNLLEMLACESTQQKRPVWERVNFVVRMHRSIRWRLRPVCLVSHIAGTDSARTRVTLSTRSKASKQIEALHWMSRTPTGKSKAKKIV